MNIKKELKDHVVIRRKGQKGSLKIYNGKRLNVVDPKKKVKTKG